MNHEPQIGIIGNGSWATALVKILTDNKHRVNWWIRKKSSIEQIKKRGHNPNYLPSAYIDVSLLNLFDDVKELVETSGLLVLAVPSAYIVEVLEQLDKDQLQNKKNTVKMKVDV